MTKQTKPPVSPVKPMRPLTRKQQAFVKELVTNPKQSAVQAALKTYGKPDKELSYFTANDIASTNLQNPSIQLELAKYSNNAESVISGYLALKDSDNIGDKRLAYDSATQILDRVHGKPQQTVSVNTSTVTVSIDLSQALADTDIQPV